MDLVTLTDHDSIVGCLELLDRHPGADDILIGEEIGCRLPGTGIRVHLGAIGLSERHHRDVQPLRENALEAAAYLRGEGVALVLHHPFHFFRGESTLREYLEPLLSVVHAVEVRNATMSAAHNALSMTITDAWNRARPASRLGTTGGSDAHIVRHAGCACTEAAGGSREEFLACLRRGDCQAAGAHGTYGRLATEIYGVIASYWRSLVGLRRGVPQPVRRLQGIALSLALMPFQFSPLVVTGLIRLGERRRVDRWRREWEDGGPSRPTAVGANQSEVV
jgi:hypothetical protein